MNQREKEEYLREYAILKAKGKPFFPYAVAKDGAMACVESRIIIDMPTRVHKVTGQRTSRVSFTI